MYPELLAQADFEITQMASEHGLLAAEQGSNGKLLEALDRCIAAAEQIEDFAASVPAPTNPEFLIEVNALEWKRDYIRKQVNRAARIAIFRKKYLNSLATAQDWEDEWERCADGISGLKHWFKYWAWALDTRADYLAVQPFAPFGAFENDEQDFQWRYIVWLFETTFIHRKSGLVEKARDMGATLGWLLWATWCWLFRDNFRALVASANVKLVDKTDDPDTLFAKVRFALELHPPQLLPEGFILARDAPWMNIANPANGSVISGQPPTADAGRQKRATCVLKDESAAWRFRGIKQARALSHVSNSIFDVSSVQGKYNHFHTQATSPGVNKFIMDWREHPWKDQRWYDSLPYGIVTDIMTSETIAQEVDRDYDASQPGKVFKDWEETRTCIEWDELLLFYHGHGLYDRFINVDGTLQIPQDWNWARMQDRGETTGHPRMTLYCARPGESWPLKDSIFFFIEHEAPTAADLGTVVTQLTEEQRQFNINPPRQPELSINSHEAEKEREVYMDEFGWTWDSWDTDYNSGISNIRLWIKPIDTHLDNPIRPALKGRSRIYLVCKKGQATLHFNPKDQKHFVSPAKDHGGFRRLRAEMPVYHYPPEEAGKPIGEQRPLRDFDDAIACVRGIAVLWGPTPKEMSDHEKMMKRMAQELQHQNAKLLPPGSVEHDRVIMSQMHWKREFEEEEVDQERRLGMGAPVRVARRTPSRE
jgi:hypothetical protein